MDKCILERIADEALNFSNGRYKTESSIYKIENFKKKIDADDEYRITIHKKLLEMLKHPNDILYEWAWNEAYFHYSFEKWLYDELTFVPVDFSKPPILKGFVNKVRKWKIQKQV